MTKLPSGVEIGNLIDDLRNFSWEASDILLYYSQIIKDANNKSNILSNNNINDPVTVADLKVNEIIIKNIKEKYKNVNWEILSEESVKIKANNFAGNSDWTWVLDPLDGTKDYIQGTSDYAMHLALNYKQKPYIGIVLIPDKEELWIANGNETWYEKRDGLKIKPNLSQNKYLKNMTLITSKNHSNDVLKNLIKEIHFKEVKIMGSIGCKISSILRGESDIYICLSLHGQSSPKDWDFAAPEAILKACGGAITNLDNEELIYGKANFKQDGIIIASSNINMHKRICSEIKEIIKIKGILPL